MMEEHGLPVNHAVRDACSHSFGPVFLAALPLSLSLSGVCLDCTWAAGNRRQRERAAAGATASFFEEIHLTAGTIAAR